MPERIKIFNVQFGDCFLLETPTNDAAMLVDFGSTRRIAPNVVCDVNSSLGAYARKYLLISHFHSDHYSGIQNLANNIIFDEVYLPNFFCREVIRLELIMLALLSPLSRSHNIALNLLTVVPNLLNHLNPCSRIYYVNRGRRIYNMTDNYRVLWPDGSEIRMDATRLYGQLVNYYGLNDILTEFESLVDGYMEIFPELERNEDYNNVMSFNERYLEQRQEILTSAQNIINQTMELFARVRREIGGYVRAFSRRITSFQNQISICFDSTNNRRNDMSGTALFLSDIDTANFQRILSETNGFRLREEYRAVKVAHHGTKDYFVCNLPSSEFLIISNGTAPSNGWRIFALYGWHYSDRTMICTNYHNACDYELSYSKCGAYCLNTCTRNSDACERCGNGKSVCGINCSYDLNL